MKAGISIKCQSFRGAQFLLCMICHDTNKNGKLPVNLNAPTITPPPHKIAKWDIANGRHIRVQSGLFALPSACDLLVFRTSAGRYTFSLETIAGATSCYLKFLVQLLSFIPPLLYQIILSFHILTFSLCLCYLTLL